MAYATDGQLPRDTNGAVAEGVYVPGVGTVAQQGASVGTDSQGTNYAATVVQLVTGTSIGQTSPYPSSATPLNATSGDVAAATAAATLGAAAGKTTYITGFSLTGAGATAASTIDVTVTDATWTITFVYVVPAGATATAPQLLVTFPYPLAASAANTTIVASSPSFGTGNLHACMNAYGFRV